MMNAIRIGPRVGAYLAAFLGLLAGPAGARAVVPNAPYEAFTTPTDNQPQAQIAGWFLPARGDARGTLFVCHGYGSNKQRYGGFQWVRDQLGWNVVIFDFREHGESSHSTQLCTLGYYEIYDVKAVVDYARGRGWARPYALYGKSMGAAVGLRWASQDPRLVGVFAQSPFRDGLSGSRQFLDGTLGLGRMVNAFAPERAKMLQEVDIPKAVAARDDLRLWILVGEKDYFPVDDERAILAASPSPPEFKRLYVIPGRGHNNIVTWPGDATVPGHDELLRRFLAECARPNTARRVIVWSLAGAAVAGCLGMLLVLLRRAGRATRAPGSTDNG